MEAPFVVDDSGDAVILDSLGDALKFYLPTQVGAKDYAAYDSAGRLLRLERGPFGMLPRLRVAEEEPAHAEELRRLLMATLARGGATLEDLLPLSIGQLVAQVREALQRYTPPVALVDRSGDVAVFTRLEDLLGWVEAVDVEDGEYTAYDSEGRLITLRPYSGTALARVAEHRPQHAEDLRRALSSYLAAMGEPEGWLLQASLTDLIARAQARR